MNKIYYFLKENIDTIESFGKGFLTILGILFLVGMCSCSSPITLEQQRFTHNFHVQNGDYYGECMYCNADIRFLLGGNINKHPWEVY